MNLPLLLPPATIGNLGSGQIAAYDDLDAIRNFARGVDVVIYEFENVPTETAVAD